MKRLLIAVAGLALLVSSAFSEAFTLDTSHSKVGFSVTHMMISSVEGNFKEYDATIDFDAKKSAFNALKAVIEAKSINTENEKRDAHLKDPDFFDVAKYPNITFVMEKYEPKSKNEGKMYGKLTMLTTTKDVVLDTEIKGIITDPWGNTRLGFELEGKINRKDFGLNWNKSLDAGGVVVGDDVKIKVIIQAKKAE